MKQGSASNKAAQDIYTARCKYTLGAGDHLTAGVYNYNVWSARRDNWKLYHRFRDFLRIIEVIKCANGWKLIFYRASQKNAWTNVIFIIIKAYKTVKVCSHIHVLYDPLTSSMDVNIIHYKLFLLNYGILFHEILHVLHYVAYNSK